MRQISLHSKKIKTNIRNLILEQIDEKDGLYEKTITYGENSVTIYIYEEYFFRINSTLSVTIILEQNDLDTNISLIASGAKVGIADLSYGTEKSALKPLIDKFIELGFEIEE